MTTFYLYSTPTPHGNRVILDKELPPKGVTLIREIEADTWIKASATIKEFEFAHTPGHGYFIGELNA